MSHIVGTLQPVGPPPLIIGPDSGPPDSPPDTWTLNFQSAPPPLGTTKFVILHFLNVSLPASNRLEVDLGYGGADTTDVFTSADGNDFWTRPVNVGAFAGGKVPIRYITNGASTGSATLDKYGRGERHSGDQDPSALSNCDPFLLDPTYVEPIYDPFWFCVDPPNWENARCVPAGDIRSAVFPSVGMIVHVDKSEFLTPQIDILSSCSVTLIGPDLAITAGHCMQNPDEDARSSSVVFNYATNCDGTRPAGYAGRFFKVKKVIAQHYQRGVDLIDYCLFQLAVAPGLPSVQMRHDVPGPTESVFGLHHPNGAVMKLSVPHSTFAQVTSSDVNDIRVPMNFHVSGGSSGSGLFDSAGRITGVLADGSPCKGTPLRYYPTASILQQIATPQTQPPISRDVMIVFDRSGSMSLPGSSGRSKIDEARDAASLFVQLVRSGTGNKVGLVSFSTNATLDLGLLDASVANKQTLIGPAPFSGGKVGALAPGGSTTIGGGLQTAGGNLPAGGANPRSILLLTDGLQNTPPMIDDTSVQNAIGGIDLNAIGYGTAANLDGTLLSSLASAHNGQYVQADTSLRLEKFFAQAFGNIFESGLLTDPDFVMPENVYTAAPLPFRTCEETGVTVVVGWDNLDTQLSINVTTPLGVTFGAGTVGTETATGRSWTFLRIALPHNGERDGQWSVTVLRPGGGGEFPLPAPRTNYFVNIIANGGAQLKRVPAPVSYYTGDPINPLVFLTFGNGLGNPENVTAQLTVTRPAVSAGNLLSQEHLHAAATVDADTIPARQATLQAIEQRTGAPAITYNQFTTPLLSGRSNTNGAFEPDGLFGMPLPDLLNMEGDYTFHVVATYGTGCVASRELQWSVHVDPSIDPTLTGVTTTVTSTNPGGSTGTVTLTPRDPFGNNLGPGRAGSLTITGTSGTTVTGAPTDNGDGSYTIPVTWISSGSGSGPTVSVSQPNRPPVILGGTTAAGAGATHCRWCWILCLLLALLALLFFVLWWL